MEKYEIKENPEWWLDGCWLLLRNGERVLASDDRRVLIRYVGLEE